MKIIHLEQTDSTNLYLEKHLKELPEICSVRADIQTAGKGRLARQWNSAKGGLWFSILFKTPAFSSFQLQKVCSLATLKSLNRELELKKKLIITIKRGYKRIHERFNTTFFHKNSETIRIKKSPPTGGCPQKGWGGFKQINMKETVNDRYKKFIPTTKVLQSSQDVIIKKPEAFLLKWPNDIYYNSRKISGCLQKNIFSSTGSSCIIGIGVNINNSLPDELSKKAINLKTILSQEINVEKLYQHILEKIERQLSNFSQQQLEIEYRKHLLIKTGVHVKVLDVINNKQHTGRVIGYPGETIEIETEEGKRLSFSAADVTLKSWED